MNSISPEITLLQLVSVEVGGGGHPAPREEKQEGKDRERWLVKLAGV